MLSTPALSSIRSTPENGFGISGGMMTLRIATRDPHGAAIA